MEMTEERLKQLVAIEGSAAGWTEQAHMASAVLSLRSRVAELEAERNAANTRGYHAGLAEERQRAATLQANLGALRAEHESQTYLHRLCRERRDELQAEVERLKADVAFHAGTAAAERDAKVEARKALAGAMSTITGLQEQVQSAGIALAESERKREELARALEETRRTRVVVATTIDRIDM